MPRIVSGGQTGVDRAALDAAIELGLPAGGWCPRGRRAEDGPIAARYAMNETPSARYPQRTRWNARDSDATLILNRGPLEGGTLLTRDYAMRVLGKPVRVVQLDGADPGVAAARAWLEANRVRVLNVAGPREGSRPGIYAEARAWLAGFLWAVMGDRYLP